MLLTFYEPLKIVLINMVCYSFGDVSEAGYSRTSWNKGILKKRLHVITSIHNNKFYHVTQIIL